MYSLRFLKMALIGLSLLLVGCSSAPSKVIKVGVDPTFYPVEAGNNDMYVFAFFNELLEEVAKLKKIRIERINRSWDNLMDGLHRNEYDIVFSSMEPRIYNEELYLFSPILLSTGPVVIVPADSSIEDVEELTNKIIGIEEFSPAVQQIARDPSVVLSYYMSPSQALNDLVNGNYQAIVMDSIIANSFVRDLFQAKLRILSHPILSHGIRALSLNKPMNREFQLLEKAIEELKAKGTYGALLKKWNLSSEF